MRLSYNKVIIRVHVLGPLSLLSVPQRNFGFSEWLVSEAQEPEFFVSGPSFEEV